jgi:hypothetical protein
MGRKSPDRDFRLTSMRISELSGGCQGERPTRQPLEFGSFVNFRTEMDQFHFNVSQQSQLLRLTSFAGIVAEGFCSTLVDATRKWRE